MAFITAGRQSVLIDKADKQERRFSNPESPITSDNTPVINELLDTTMPSVWGLVLKLKQITFAISDGSGWWF